MTRLWRAVCNLTDPQLAAINFRAVVAALALTALFAR